MEARGSCVGVLAMMGVAAWKEYVDSLVSRGGGWPHPPPTGSVGSMKWAFSNHHFPEEQRLMDSNGMSRLFRRYLSGQQY